MLNSETTTVDDENLPDKVETMRFWNLWGTPVHHNQDAEWFSDDVGNADEQQKDRTVTVAMIRKQLKKLPKCKAPGPDGIQELHIPSLKNCNSNASDGG